MIIGVDNQPDNSSTLILDNVTAVGTRIDNGMWMQNNDDGWYHVTLPFDFNWFGITERIITIGTNGVLTFGTAQLPYGSSEPVCVAVIAGDCNPTVVHFLSGLFAIDILAAPNDNLVYRAVGRCRVGMVTCRATVTTTQPMARCLLRESLLPSGQT